MMDKKSSRCAICGRVGVKDEGFCIFHSSALANVKAKFSQWQEAYDDISWERYLERIFDLNETGDSSKEIARHLLRRGSGTNTKGS